MRFSLMLGLVLCVAIAHGAPLTEDKEEEVIPTTVPPKSEEVTEVPSEKSALAEKSAGTARADRQLDDDDEEETESHENDEDDDEESEDDDADEEEEETKDTKTAIKKKPAAAGKPVPVLGEGLEDDEAEDLGIEFKASHEEKASNEEKASDEEKSEEEQDDQSEESEESGSTGLVADPVSSERGDVDESSVVAPQNEASEKKQPLAIALVQPEESSDPVVPILVEETVVADSSKAEKGKDGPSRKSNPTKQDDESDDDDEDEDEDGDSSRARSAYPSPVLYYYPFPESPVKPEAY